MRDGKTTMSSLRLVGLIVGLLTCCSLAATEVRVVRFQTLPPDFSGPPCPSFVQWASQTFFQNTTDAPQVVRFLAVSNGDPRPNPRPLTIAPHRAISIGSESGLDWEPMQRSILWVNQLDVPDGVLVANRIQVGTFEPDRPETPCMGKSARYAGLPLPVFSSLVPGGSSQYFLGLDVGSNPGQQITDSRINIGVYNGGGTAATATVNVYCGGLGFDPTFANTLLATVTIQVPSNALAQKTVLASTQAALCPAVGVSFWYATVTADQPSFAYAIGLSNEAPPKFPGAVALSYSR